MDADQPSPPLNIPDSEELFNFLLEHIPDLIFFKDRHSRFICVNHAMMQRFGLTCLEEILGKTDQDILLPADAERTRIEELEVLQTGVSIEGHVSKKVRPDGRTWWSLTTKLPLRNAQDEVIGTCGISKDITQLKEAEDALERSNANLEHTLIKLKAAQEQLISSAKAQSVALLAAGVAHEVRNPLNILSTGIELFTFDSTIASNPTLKMVLQEMRNAIQRADAVISTLMEASSPKGLNLEQVEVNAMFGSFIIEFSDKLEAAGIKMAMSLAPENPIIKADRTKLKQVLEGIISNASEAMPEGGSLHVSTRLETLAPGDVFREAGARSGQKFHSQERVLKIEVADTGMGIPDQVLKKVFDPFFTTKETGSGLGLGLTVCRAIIELHGGSLEIANRQDCRGTKAVLTLKTLV